MTDVIAEPCTGVKDKACAGEMPGQQHLPRPTDALHPPRRVRRLWRMRAVCPVEAIVCEDDVPGRGPSSPARTRSSPAQLGSPGGAAKTGPLPDDTNHVASHVTSR
jgi:hypothetical protein